MRRVTLAAGRDVLRQLRIVRHVAMRTGLLAAGRGVLGGIRNQLIEGAVAIEALVFRRFSDRPGCGRAGAWRCSRVRYSLAAGQPRRQRQNE